MKYAVRSLLLSVLAVTALGCDKATPTAPSGSTLAISANPTRIGLNGSATITVIGRMPNGSPLREGTEIYLATSLGSIDQLVLTDRDGVARATLRGDGRNGTATVTAATGPVSGGGGGSGGSGGSGGTAGSSGTSVVTQEATVSVSTTVEIGNAPRTIVLQASPTNLSSEGGEVRLTALVRDSNGQPLRGANVNFLTELGRLRSGGALKTTDANGQATDTLTVTAADISISNTTGFSVTAQTTAADGALVSVDFRIQVQSDRPIADFAVESAGQFEVVFRSTSTGLEPLEFEWDFGDTEPDPDQETLRNPRHDYRAAGRFTVTLRVANDSGEDVEVKQIDVQNGRVTIVEED